MSCVPLRLDRHYSIAGESSHGGVPSDRLFTPRETCYRNEYARISNERDWTRTYIVSNGPVRRYVYTKNSLSVRSTNRSLTQENRARNQPTVVDRLPSTSRFCLSFVSLFSSKSRALVGNSFSSLETSTDSTFVSFLNRLLEAEMYLWTMYRNEFDNDFSNKVWTSLTKEDKLFPSNWISSFVTSSLLWFLWWNYERFFRLLSKGERLLG